MHGIACVFSLHGTGLTESFSWSSVKPIWEQWWNHVEASLLELSECQVHCAVLSFLSALSLVLFSDLHFAKRSWSLQGPFRQVVLWRCQWQLCAIWIWWLRRQCESLWDKWCLQTSMHQSRGHWWVPMSEDLSVRKFILWTFSCFF